MLKSESVWIQFLKNKYVIVTLLFFILVLFFDDNNIAYHIDNQNKIKELEAKKKELTLKIEQRKQALEQLQPNHPDLEKFARENHFMKKDSEDVFIIMIDSLK